MAADIFKATAPFLISADLDSIVYILEKSFLVISDLREKYFGLIETWF